MNKLIILVAILFLSGCNSTMRTKHISKPVTEKSAKKDTDYQYAEKFQLIPNASVELLKDNIGKTYIKFDSGKKTIFRYQYKKTGLNKNLMDAAYSQEIFFEIANPVQNTTLKDAELAQVNLLVGKQCFCRDSGVYSVKKGNLEIKVLDKNNIEINVEITTPPVSLEKTKIHQIIHIK